MKERKKQLRVQITRDRILDAALVLIAKDGPENFTLTKVVRQSGVHRATIYLHFKTRDDVLAAASERFAEKFHSEVLGSIIINPAPLPGGRALVDLTNRFAQFVMDNPDLGQIWLNRLLTLRDPAQDPVWSAYEGSYRRLFNSDVAHDGLDSEVVAMLILSGTVLWPLWARTNTRSKAKRTTHVARLTENLFRIALNGILKPEYFPEITRYLEQSRKTP